MQKIRKSMLHLIKFLHDVIIKKKHFCSTAYYFGMSLNWGESWKIKILKKIIK